VNAIPGAHLDMPVQPAIEESIFSLSQKINLFMQAPTQSRSPFIDCRAGAGAGSREPVRSGMTEHSLLIRGGRPGGGAAADIRIADGRIAEIAPALAPRAGEAVEDVSGLLVLPGLVDAHMHLDKTLTGLPWMPHAAGPTRASRIDTEKQVRDALPLSVEERAMALARQCAAFGSSWLRSHVDVDPEGGLSALEGVLAARERCRGLIDVQIVAFPQSGVARAPGVPDLLDAAIGMGAEIVGGMDPAGYDNDPVEQLDTIFAIADRHGVGIDIHLHDPGELGLWQIGLVAERARALGMAGKVLLSHAFCLDAPAGASLDRAIDQLAAAGIAIVTYGPGGPGMPPVMALRARGVAVAAGNDNIRDGWSPFGDGDMLERAMLIAHRAGWRTDPDIEVALDMASGAAAAVLGIEGHGLAVGRRADLFAVAGDAPAEAVASRPPRASVVKAGRVVARDGRLL